MLEMATYGLVGLAAMVLTSFILRGDEARSTQCTHYLNEVLGD